MASFVRKQFAALVKGWNSKFEQRNRGYLITKRVRNWELRKNAARKRRREFVHYTEI